MKYTTIRVRHEIVEILRKCQRPGEPLSDTLTALLDPMRIHEREKRRKGGTHNEKGSSNRKGKGGA